MKIQEILMELGDRPSQYKITRNTDEIFEATSGDIIVSMEIVGDNTMQIVFMVDNQFGITGKGDAVKVLSTVFAILKDNLESVINSREVAVVYFTADVDEPSRIKLYDRFQKIMDRLLGPEWSGADRRSAYGKTYKWANIDKISQNARSSMMYARDVLNGPFQTGEPAIATDAHYSYVYANDILHNAFPLGEKAIASRAFYSYLYAKDVLNGRFELGEPAIKKDDRYVKKYYELTGIEL